MSLTVKEKEHWKERIARKIELAIETLCAEQDPHFRERVRNEARRRAIESLGIAAPHGRLGEVELAKESLKREKDKLLNAMCAELLGADQQYAAYGLESAIEKANWNRRFQPRFYNAMCKSYSVLKPSSRATSTSRWLADCHRSPIQLSSTAKSRQC